MRTFKKLSLRFSAAFAAGCLTASLLSFASFAAETVVAGDVNADGKVTLEDAADALRFYLNYTALDERTFRASDLNGSGRLDLNDVMLILRKYLNGGSEPSGTGGASGSASLLDDYKSKYFYSTLNDKQKIAYERMFEAAQKFEQPDLSDLDLDWEQMAEASFALKYENPQFFYLSNSSSLSYNMSKEEALEIKPKLEAAAKKIADKAMAQSDMKQRVKVIHDEICKMTTYKLTYSEPYGPLLYGEALCEGYGKTFAYIAQMCGIPTISITGFAATGGHLWNMIKLGDEWLHIDVTFDDQTSGMNYVYFCVDDHYIGDDHVPDDTLKFPTKLPELFDQAKIEAEFKRFMAQIKANYDKGIMTTRFSPDCDPMGGFLKYTVYNMNYGVYDMGINKTPYYMYSGNWNWVEIQLK